MFRLIKLAIYGLLGYVLYEFVRGLADTEPMAGSSSKSGGGSRNLQKALNRNTGRSNMTGRGKKGSRVTSEEPSGQSVPHVVGRGVVS